MISITIDKSDLNRVYKLLDSLSPTKREGVLRKSFAQAGAAVEDQLKLNSAGGILLFGNGMLARSIQSRVQDDMTIVIGSGVRTGARLPYANIHETGGTIRPKNKPYLWFPIYTSARIARMKGGSYSRLKKSQRTYQWVRTKLVKIPPRRYMSITAEQMAPKVFKIMVDAIERIKKEGTK